MERRTIEVQGAERTYWTASPPVGSPAPLLVVLHGAGLSGPVMAQWTGLDVRGPEAGFLTVFPEAEKELWDDVGLGRLDGLDDAAFVSALVDRLVAEEAADAGRIFLAGLSNGAGFAERLARHDLVAATGIVLVAGTAREASRRAVPRPRRSAAVLSVAGTGDGLAPYAGGPATGVLSWIARRRRRHVLSQPDRAVVAAEVVAADWATANGCPDSPSVERVPGDVAVDLLAWTAPGCRPVALYRIEGGGHGWPGGPQYLPARILGRVVRHPDATGLLLGFAREQLGRE